MISENPKFIHIHIPKTAGTSIAVALGYPRGKTPDHRTAAMVKKATKEWNSYFKFVFVRNPWDWVVSHFFSKNKNKLATATFEEKRLAFRQYAYRIRGWDRQSDFFQDKEGNCLVDFIGRFENLKEEFDYVCKQLGIEVQIHHLNPSSHNHYHDYYDDKSKDRVAFYFKKDIELLDYEF